VKLRIARYLLMMIATTIIFFACKYGLANLSYLKVDSYLMRWQESKQLTQDELDDALQATDTMLALHGHFPHYLNVAAKVYEWQAFNQHADRTLYQASLSQALVYYQNSTALREHWPLTWVFMANVKANLQQFDEQFYYYIDQAIKYGPYTHQVNLQIAKLQLQYWGELEQFSTKIGIEQIKRTLLNHHSRNALLYYARDIERIGLVCAVGRLNKIKVATQHALCRQ